MSFPAVFPCRFASAHTDYAVLGRPREAFVATAVAILVLVLFLISVVELDVARSKRVCQRLVVERLVAIRLAGRGCRTGDCCPGKKKKKSVTGSRGLPCLSLPTLRGLPLL